MITAYDPLERLAGESPKIGKAAEGIFYSLILVSTNDNRLGCVR